MEDDTKNEVASGKRSDAATCSVLWNKSGHPDPHGNGNHYSREVLVAASNGQKVSFVAIDRWNDKSKSWETFNKEEHPCSVLAWAELPLSPNFKDQEHGESR